MKAYVDIYYADDVSEEEQDGVAIVAVLSVFCELAQRVGLTKEQAVERVGSAVALAWED